MIKYEILPYKFMDDVAYPMISWYYFHFKGRKMNYSEKKTHWNFI